MKTIVSFIIPVYNIESCIERCVRSVLSQSVPNFECICVDDGSSDNSGLILDALAKEDSRIKVVHQPNSGVSVARNTGLSAASGDYVAFVDSDDAVAPYFLESALPNMESDPELDLWIGQRVVVNMEMIPYKDQPKVIQDMTEANPIQRFMRIDGRYYLYCVWGKLFRRAVIQQNNLQFAKDVSLGEDSLFAAEYYAVCNKVMIEDKCFGYLHSQRDGSLVRRHWADLVPNYMATIRVLLWFGDMKDVSAKIQPLAVQWALGRFSVMFHPGYENLWMRKYIVALCRHPEFKATILGTIVKYGNKKYALVAKMMSLTPRRMLIEILFLTVCLNNLLRGSKS